MKSLSIELQLLVIAHLPPRDIVHLQQTCKALHALIEDFDDGIWQECLLRQCLQNGVFWPTYKDLRSASQLKNAATSILEALQQPLRFSQDEKLMAMNEVHLIPGGRFFLIIEDRRVVLWDLQPQSPAASVPDLVVAREYADKMRCASNIDVVNAMAIHILAEFQPSISNSGHTLKFVLLEIGLSDSANCAIRMERFLTIYVNWVTQPIANIDAYHGDRVAIFIKSDDDSELAVTVVWDFVQDTWCFWWVELDVVDIALMEDCVLYFHKSGVNTRDIPPLKAVAGGSVAISAYQDEDTHPSGLWPYKKPVELRNRLEMNPFAGPELFNPSRLADGRPIVYEVTEATAAEDTIHQRRYRLKQYHDGPKLQLVEWFHLTCADSNAFDVDPTERRICENRLVTLWTDFDTRPTAHYVSLSPLSTYTSRPARSSPAHKSTFPLIRLQTQTVDGDATSKP
ncbi:hypothetical protein FA13DRAFT_1787008 [Coprinellus micaceus]|uniref:F-box domain-containing protein n=1 Tax=Coprinellus micaceus TaxID=71717 RepID=A0A4Y7TR13_COPMI|nr:hypothetical protein FA13DRAFT_1787008 [Coprinellus micaceus]